MLDASAWLFLAALFFMSEADPATRGLDNAAGVAVTGFFLVSAVPALLLAARRRAPRTALLLALAFPGLVLLLGVSVALLLP